MCTWAGPTCPTGNSLDLLTGARAGWLHLPLNGDDHGRHVVPHLEDILVQTGARLLLMRDELLR
jgi:hypothetical protein